MTTDTIHCFTTAGLGRAPFTYVGCYEDRGPHVTILEGGIRREVGAPGQPMGTCAFCGRGIAICCTIESADGKRSTIGSECIKKYGDAGLQTRVNRARKDFDRARKEATAWKSREALAVLIANNAALLASHPHPYIGGKTWLDYATWCCDHVGNNTIHDVLRRAQIKVAEGKVV